MLLLSYVNDPVIFSSLDSVSLTQKCLQLSIFTVQKQLPDARKAGRKGKEPRLSALCLHSCVWERL